MKSLVEKFHEYMDSHPRMKKAQSFVELALIFPVLLIILLNVVELSFMISQYLDILDLTREAARFASVRDPFDNVTPDQDCSTINAFDFYYDTACIFSPSGTDSTVCDRATDPFCNGLNDFMTINKETDDVVVTVFSVSDAGGYGVKEAWPHSPLNAFPNDNGYWALSNNDNQDNDGDPTTRDDNWRYDCHGNIVRTEPYYTITTVSERLVKTPSSAHMIHSKGFVAVEFYYCYEPVLGAPIFTSVVGSPLRLHAYTIMALPAGAPTPTPRATETTAPGP